MAEIVKGIEAANEAILAAMPKKEESPSSNGATAISEETKTETKVEEPKLESKPDVQTAEAESDLQKFLKENNLSSVDELKDKITPKRQKTEDEEKAELIDWAVKNENMKVDDFLSAEEIQKKKDADVVFDDYAEKLKAKNKNITPEEVQKKWDKQFGDVIDTGEVDEDGNAKTKIVYDEDEIAERAKVIREIKLQPIATAKSKFTNVQKEQEFNSRIQKEWNEIASTIPDKVKIKIDDKNSLDYELEPSYKATLIPKLAEQYAFFRKSAPNEKLDANNFQNFVSNVVMQDNFGNIANIFASKKVSEKELEHVKKLENPIVTPLDLNTGGKPTVDMGAEAAKLRANLPKF